MKKFVYLLPAFFAFSFFGCGWNNVDPVKARTVAENFLTDQKTEKYDNINDYFTPAFNESEPREQKIEKLKKIKDAIGSIESFELIDSTLKNNGLDDLPTMQLKYKVKYERATAEQTFIIINEEGRHQITFQNIETKN